MNSSINYLATGILLSSLSSVTHAFTPGSIAHTNHNHHHKQQQTLNSCPSSSSSSLSTCPNTSTSLQTSIFDDFEEFESSSTSSSSDNLNQADLFASLRARQDYLGNGFSSINTNSNNNSNNSIQNNNSPFTTNNPSSSTKSPHQENLLQKWKEAECSSSVRLSLNDWIRRVAVDTYPLAVCGSANGNIYLADLEKGEELDCITSVHEAQIDDESVTDAMKKLYGLYDGGGVLSVAIRNDIVVSAGREGGVHVFKIDGEEESYYKGSRGGSARTTKLHLESQGKIRALESTLVTSLTFDKDSLLWTGGYDGFIRAFEYDDTTTPLVTQKEPVFEMDAGSEILSVSVNNEIGCGVAATAAGTIVLFSMEEGEILAQWKSFGKGVGKRRREYARCATIVQNDEESINEHGDKQEAVWSIISGGSEGSMYQRRLNIDSFGYVSDRKPFINDETLRGRLRPSHSSLVMDLATPSPGLLISGSQDGTIRMWDCSYYRNKSNDDNASASILQEEDEAYCDDIGGVDRRPQCLYTMTGFKAWLGSIFTNGELFVTDGADNNVYVHDFSDEDNTEGFLFEDDDLDDLEDFSFD